jgi:hypothetical protein
MNDQEELLAREAIKETKARYCRLLDTKQWHDWGQVFTEDVEMDVGDDIKEDMGVPSKISGRQAMVDQVRGLVGPARTIHQVHSSEIDFVSVTEARVVWAMEDWTTFPDGIDAPFKSVNGLGYYHETYRLEDGFWRIASLRLERLQQIYD